MRLLVSACLLGVPCRYDGGSKPCAQFKLCEGDSVVAAFAYCNLHGLWKQDA